MTTTKNSNILSEDLCRLVKEKSLKILSSKCEVAGQCTEQKNPRDFLASHLQSDQCGGQMGLL
jgi:hypothetical protein